MIAKSIIKKTDLKQRLTTFIKPSLVTRVKVQGALVDLTVSEIVEKAIDAYTPKLKKDN